MDWIHGQSADVFEDASVTIGGRSYGIAARCFFKVQRMKLSLGSIMCCPSQDIFSLRRRSFAWKIQEMFSLVHGGRYWNNMTLQTMVLGVHIPLHLNHGRLENNNHDSRCVAGDFYLKGALMCRLLHQTME